MEPQQTNIYQISEDVVTGMAKLCHPGVKGVVFMVDFVHLVQERIMVEASVPPIEDEIVEIVQEQDLQRKLRKMREICESEGYSLTISQIDQQRIEDQLIYNEILNKERPQLRPIGFLPGPWRFFVAKMLLKTFTPSKVAWSVEKKANSLNDDVNSHRSYEDELHLILNLHRPKVLTHAIRQSHDAKQQGQSSKRIGCSFFCVPFSFYFEELFQFAYHNIIIALKIEWSKMIKIMKMKAQQSVLVEDFTFC